LRAILGLGRSAVARRSHLGLVDPGCGGDWRPDGRGIVGGVVMTGTNRKLARKGEIASFLRPTFSRPSASAANNRCVPFSGLLLLDVAWKETSSFLLFDRSRHDAAPFPFHFNLCFQLFNFDLASQFHVGIPDIFDIHTAFQ
jgi:hypothetical protein